MTGEKRDLIADLICGGDGLPEVPASACLCRSCETALTRADAILAALEEENKRLKLVLETKGAMHDANLCTHYLENKAKDALVGRLENVVEAARLYVLARAIVDSGLDDDTLSPDQIGEMTKDMNDRLTDLDAAVAAYDKATR